MFEKYQSEVLQCYQEKKKEGSLLTNLLHPTPANLKKECTGVFDRRYLKIDEVALSSFFDPQENEEAYRVAIRKFDRDKFKPLITVLKNGGGKTDRKNLELLAWLIGFEPRPYPIWLKKQEGKSEDAPLDITLPNPIQPEPGPVIESTVEPEKNTETIKPVVPRTARQTLIIILLLVSLGGTAYWFWPKPAVKPAPSPVTTIVPGKYMYWAGDNYLPCAYGRLHGDTPVVALDSFKLAGFKKITDWSTLSRNSIRKVWYAKVNGKIEVYTVAGFHPVDTNKRLLPLSKWILDKYIHPN